MQKHRLPFYNSVIQDKTLISQVFVEYDFQRLRRLIALLKGSFNDHQITEEDYSFVNSFVLTLGHKFGIRSDIYEDIRSAVCKLAA